MIPRIEVSKTNEPYKERPAALISIGINIIERRLYNIWPKTLIKLSETYDLYKELGTIYRTQKRSKVCFNY